MNIKALRWAAAIVTLALVIPAGSAKLYAIDANNRYFAYGLGQRTCEDYVKVREKKFETLEQDHPRYTKEELYEIVDRVVEHWIAGFITAHNFYVSDTYDVAGKTNMDELKASLEKSCRTNPKQHFAQAMIALVQQLNPQRVRTSGGK